MSDLAFGPVPSRRLGRSLGINNIPHKVCSYACVYCQVGRTAELTAERREFLPPARLAREVEQRLRDLRSRREPVDYLAFVPDGEPTVDSRLGEAIEALRPLGVPVAVLSIDRELNRLPTRAGAAGEGLGAGWKPSAWRGRRPAGLGSCSRALGAGDMAVTSPTADTTAGAGWLPSGQAG